ncbi:hypothetical protein HDR63_03550 [bacterium]|nr:hypothetical protein [bacterium]
MYKHYAEEEIQTVLEYAAKKTIAAASRKFKIPKSTIRSWNKTRHIVPTRTYIIRTQTEWMEILKYARDFGGPEAASLEYNVSVPQICAENKKLNVYDPQQCRQFTDAQRRMMLRYANTHGLIKACHKFGVAKQLLLQWAEKLGEYTKLRRSYTKEEKIIILTDARDHSVDYASKKYDVSPQLICQWNKIFNIYPSRTNRKFTPDERIAYLTEAKNLMFSDPVTYPTVRLCFEYIYQKHNIHPAHLYIWNQKYDIVPTQPRIHAPRPVSQAEIDLVKNALAENRGRVARAARKLEMTSTQIQRIIAAGNLLAKYR